MKRIVCLLLSVCLVLTVAACGSSDSDPKEPPIAEENPFEQCADGDIVTDLTNREWIVNQTNPEYYLTADGTIIAVNSNLDDNSIFRIGVVTKEDTKEDPKDEKADRPAEGEIVYDNDGTPWIVSEAGELCFVNGVVCSDPTDENGNLIEGWFSVDRYVDDSNSSIGNSTDDPYDLGDPDLYGANAKADSFYEWDNSTAVPGEIVYDNDGTPWIVSEAGEFCFVNGVVCSDPTDENGNLVEGWFSVDRYVDDSNSSIGNSTDDPYDLGDPDLYGANAKADSFYEWDNPTIVTDVDGKRWIVVSVDWDYYMTPDGYIISDPTDETGNLRDDLLTVCAWE